MSPTNEKQEPLEDVDTSLDPKRAGRFCDDFYLDDDDEEEGEEQ